MILSVNRGSDLDIPKDETEDMIKDDLTIPDTVTRIDKRAFAPFLVENCRDAQTMVVDVDVCRQFLAAVLFQWVAVDADKGQTIVLYPFQHIVPSVFHDRQLKLALSLDTCHQYKLMTFGQ